MVFGIFKVFDIVLFSNLFFYYGGFSCDDSVYGFWWCLLSFDYFFCCGWYCICLGGLSFVDKNISFGFSCFGCFLICVFSCVGVDIDCCIFGCIGSCFLDGGIDVFVCDGVVFFFVIRDGICC